MYHPSPTRPASQPIAATGTTAHRETWNSTVLFLLTAPPPPSLDLQRSDRHDLLVVVECRITRDREAMGTLFSTASAGVIHYRRGWCTANRLVRQKLTVVTKSAPADGCSSVREPRRPDGDVGLSSMPVVTRTKTRRGPGQYIVC